MNKLTAFILLMGLSPILGGLYGILHDQLTYTISPEYYTKFKFYQFRLATEGDEAIFPNPRIQVSIVGVMATWWMGLIIGSILTIVSLKHIDGSTMFHVTLKAVVLTIIIALFTGLIGLYRGSTFTKTEVANWHLPSNLVDYQAFIKVGSMHNYSYLGGAIGLIISIIYSLFSK
jgi:hypothetical protein